MTIQDPIKTTNATKNKTTILYYIRSEHAVVKATTIFEAQDLAKHFSLAATELGYLHQAKLPKGDLFGGQLITSQQDTPPKNEFITEAMATKLERTADYLSRHKKLNAAPAV